LLDLLFILCLLHSTAGQQQVQQQQQPIGDSLVGVSPAALAHLLFSMLD
jgi:hypothetical protein